MPSFDEIVNSCHLTLPNGSVVDCTSISRPHQYMSHTMVCYSLFEKERTSLPDEQLMYSHEIKKQNEITTAFLRAKLTIPWNGSEHSALDIRSHDSPIQLLRSTESKAWLEPKVDEQVFIRYSITRRVELPPPHGSFRHFPPPFDADSAMMQCWFNNYYSPDSNTTLMWPQWVFFDYEKNYTQEQLSRMLCNNEDDFRFTNKMCSEKHQRVDCDKTYIVVHKVASKRTDRQAR